ncbi:MAG: hypothetical protein ABI150_15725 [Nitrobacter sp.]
MTRPPRPTIRSRLLTILCVVLTLSLGISTVVSASEAVHHELEVAQAGSATTVLYCQGDDRSCGLPDHDEDNVIPHLHATYVGMFSLPAIDGPVMARQLVAINFALPPALPVEGTTPRMPDRPPRTTCI